MLILCETTLSLDTRALAPYDVCTLIWSTMFWPVQNSRTIGGDDCPVLLCVHPNQSSRRLPKLFCSA